MAELVTVEERKSGGNTVLVVDKEGSLGRELVQKIASYATTVFVSTKKPYSASTIHIPFSSHAPEIPEGNYTHIFLVSISSEDELLTPLLQKAQKDNAKLLFIIPYWLYVPGLEEKLSVRSSRWALVLLGDMFGAGMDTHIDRIFDQAKHKKSIRLPDLGLETVRPVAYKDIFDAIFRVGFGLEKEHICFVFSKHPYTALSIVHALQKLDPLVRMDFVGKTESLNPVLPKGLYLFEENYPVMAKLQEAYESHSLIQTTYTFEKQKDSSIITKTGKTSGRSLLPMLLFFIGIGFFIILPVLVTYCAGVLGNILLHKAEFNIEHDNFTQAHTYATASSRLYDLAVQSGGVWKREAGWVGLSSLVSSIPAQQQALYQFSQMTLFITEAALDFSTLPSNTVFAPKATFTDGLAAVKNALILWDSLPISVLPKDTQAELQKLQPLKSKVGELMDVLPQLLGFDKEKTYALMFDDNTELRPGGGKTLAYGLVTIRNGKLGKLEMYDIYQADDQLKGHVEPPFAIRRYLQQPHWYLRDSNFSIDNVKNAQSAAFFLNQETGTRVDGVIVLDMTFLKNIVAVLGNVTLPEYNETVTKNNFSQILISRAQKSNIDLTTTGKDFTTSLLQAIDEKVQKNHLGIMALANTVFTALEQKDVLLAFSDASIQQLFTVNNMSDALWDSRQSGGNVVNDITGINEANLGFNKVNAFMKRTLQQSVVIAPTGTISATLIIRYQNLHNNTWPGGDYRNYLRFILPQGVEITNVSLNSIPESRFPAVIDPKLYEAKGFKAPKGLEIEHTQEGNRDVYGFFVTIPASSSLSVSFAYTLSQKLDLTSQAATFDELLLKQPGINADSYTYSLSYPSNLTLVNKPNGTSVTKHTALITQPLGLDRDYHFTFIKQ